MEIEFTKKPVAEDCFFGTKSCPKELYRQVNAARKKYLVLDFVDYEFLYELALASYRFDKYKTLRKDLPLLEKVFVVSSDPETAEKGFLRTKAQIDGVFFARNITSEPSNILYPRAYAERLLELEEYGIEVEILEEKELRAIGMTALLAVGQGSPYCSHRKGSVL